MVSHLAAVGRAALFVCAAPAVVTAAVNDARAQARFELSYTISLARISFAEVTVSAEIGVSEYSMFGDGRIRSLTGAATTSTGSSSVRGIVEGSRLVPTTFNSKSAFEGEPLDVTVTFEDGNVKEVSASKSKRAGAQLDDAQRRAVLDPLTALLIPADLTDAACRRTVRIFDGYQRFDVALAFKRMGAVKAKEGYAGPAVVCSGAYKPVGGYRGSATVPGFMMDLLVGREMEITLAPVSGTGVLAPFQTTIESMLGNAVAQASRFKAVAQ